jgi:DNA polymerase-3 subunit epsilon
LANVYINLLDQKEPTLNFKNEVITETRTNSINTNQYYKKIIKPTDEQIKLHQQYLKTNLKKNFF